MIFVNGYIIYNINYLNTNSLYDFFKDEHLIKTVDENIFLNIKKTLYPLFILNNEQKKEEFLSTKLYNNKIIINTENISLLLLEELFENDNFSVSPDDKYYLYIKDHSDRNLQKKKKEYKSKPKIQNINIQFFNNKFKLLEEISKFNDTNLDSKRWDFENYFIYKNIVSYNNKYNYYSNSDLKNSIILLKKNIDEDNYNNLKNKYNTKISFNNNKNQFKEFIHQYSIYIKHKVIELINKNFNNSYNYDIYHEIKNQRWNYFNKHKLFLIIKNKENIDYLKSKENKILLKELSNKLEIETLDNKKNLIKTLSNRFFITLIFNKDMSNFELDLNKSIDKYYIWIKQINENRLRKFSLSLKLIENINYNFLIKITKILKNYIINYLNYNIWKILHQHPLTSDKYIYNNLNSLKTWKLHQFKIFLFLDCNFKNFKITTKKYDLLNFYMTFYYKFLMYGFIIFAIILIMLKNLIK